MRAYPNSIILLVYIRKGLGQEMVGWALPLFAPLAQPFVSWACLEIFKPRGLNVYIIALLKRSATLDLPVEEASDSQYCPVDEVSESDAYPIEELSNSQDLQSSCTNIGQRRVTRSYMVNQGRKSTVT
ncbi:hypothetical protein CTI12_AA571540 [Artemisia annua]|uniref:Uncharacterized protein n=1 Tax=Artemisia annua TaxID=35608 RepID=A0A2U1KRX0_ARTAN|nr:hypothetical protein CTI12_AA571540 [Artemisia annua]